MALRLLFLLLVLVNLVFFAWSQGHLGPIDSDREPERLGRQLNPEKLRIMPAEKPSAAKRDEAVCHLVSGLSLVEAEALSAAAAAAGAATKLLPVAEPAFYLVVIPNLASKAATDRKIAELGRLGIANLSTVVREDGGHEIVLGRFPTEPAATEFLQRLAKRGVKSARVDTREQPATKANVELRGNASTLQQQLPALLAPYAGATPGECALAKQ